MIMESSIKEFKLPKVFADKWLTALRSGDYEQTKEMLYSTGESSGTVTRPKQGYCCLGVAGAICGYSLEQMEDQSDLFSLIREWGEPSEMNGIEVPNELANSDESFTEQCIKLNDSMDYTFAEIADWLEQNVEFY